MISKKIYLCQELGFEDLNVAGLGSIYLAGPRDVIDGESWRFDLIRKIEKLGVNVTFLIPELPNKSRTEDILPHDRFNWQRNAISAATAIAFWFPKVMIPDPISIAEFGAWHKSERVFFGTEDPKMEYLDFIFHLEQKMHAANTLDQLADNIVHWIIG
jgi:hypothetical protein